MPLLQCVQHSANTPSTVLTMYCNFFQDLFGPENSEFLENWDHGIFLSFFELTKHFVFLIAFYCTLKFRYIYTGLRQNYKFLTNRVCIQFIFVPPRANRVPERKSQYLGTGREERRGEQKKEGKEVMGSVFYKLYGLKVKRKEIL